MDVGLAIARIALGLYLVAHGLQLLSPQGSAGAAKGFAHGGLRGGRTAVFAAGVTQLGSGVLLVAGFLTPLAGMGVAGVMIVAAQVLWKAGFWAQKGGWEYPGLLTILGLSFIWSGGGKYSLDRAISWTPLAWPWALAGTVAAVAVALVTVVVLRAPAPQSAPHVPHTEAAP